MQVKFFGKVQEFWFVGCQVPRRNALILLVVNGHNNVSGLVFDDSFSIWQLNFVICYVFSDLRRFRGCVYSLREGSVYSVSAT